MEPRLTKLGRSAKKLNPREFASMSDEDAGLAWLDIHPGTVPDDYSPPAAELIFQPAPGSLTARSQSMAIDFQSKAGLEELLDTSLSSPVVDDIQCDIDNRNTRKLGIFAFFNRKGEEARTKLAQAQAAHARAKTELEEAKLQAQRVAFAGATLKQDLLRAKIIEVANAQVQLATAQQQLEFITVHTTLVKQAAERGFTFATDEELRKKKAEIDHELHRIEEEERIKIQSIRQTEEIKFEFREREIEAEIEGELRLANTDEQVRLQQVNSLLDWNKKLQRARKPYERQICQKEIDRLEKALYGESSGTASQAAAGQAPQGGSTPPKSGSQSSTVQGDSEQQPPSSETRHVN